MMAPTLHHMGFQRSPSGGLVFFGFAAPFFGAISQIWLGFGGESRCRCESGNAMAKEEEEMTKGQRYERGVRQRGYIALPLPFRILGFLGNRSRDLRFSEFSATEGGPLPGLSHSPNPYHRFISAICYGSPNIHRLLRQPLWLSNYYCTTITPVSSPRFCFLQVDCYFLPWHHVTMSPTVRLGD